MEFLGGGHILVIEENDELAKHYQMFIDRFPKGKSSRARNATEALKLLNDDKSIQAVIILGAMHTVLQARPYLEQKSQNM